jgi:predicted metal-dependent hydrolase
MNNTNYSLQFEDINVRVQRKAVKNLRLVVKHSGEVRVSSPWFVPKFAVHKFVASRLDWIREQQNRFAQQPVLPAIEMRTGETHYLQGAPYSLQIIEHSGRPRLEIINNDILNLHVSMGASRAQRAALLHGHYRTILQRELPLLIAKWQPVMNVSVESWGVRKMKTRWGSCNIRARRIWLNLELARYSPACLEYVAVHEMTHLLEPSHNQRFKSLMDTFLPDWKIIKSELNGGL